MNPKSEYLIDLIFKKLKNYKAKEIILERENLKKFINSLFKEDWIRIMNNFIILWQNDLVNIIMYNFSSLTIFLIITFIVSLFLLLKVTSSAKN